MTRRDREHISSEQLEQAVKSLGDELGRIPKSTEFRQRCGYVYYRSVLDEYPGGYVDLIHTVFGGSNYNHTKTDEQMLQALRDFCDQHGHVPLTKDFRDHVDGLSTAATYNKRFGSLNAARLKAGLKAIVHKSTELIEMTAEELSDYQHGTGPYVDQKLINRRNKRNRLRQRNRITR